MMSSPAEDDEPLHATDDPETTTKKSERKRQREKQRRSDLANAFDELGALMAKVEPEDLDDSGNSRKRKRGKPTDSHDADLGDSTGMTRLDLIGRTIETIRRLHRENAELKYNLEEMRRKAGDEKEVLVMVPTLTATDDRGQHQPARPVYQSYYGQYQQQPPPPPPPHMNHGPPPPAPPSQQDHGGAHLGYYAGMQHQQQQQSYQPPYAQSWSNQPPPPPPHPGHLHSHSHAYAPHPSGPQAPPPPMYDDHRGQSHPHPSRYGTYPSPREAHGQTNGSGREE